MELDLKLKGNKIILGDREVELTSEQMKDLGIRSNPFDIENREKYYGVNRIGEVSNDNFCKTSTCDNFLLASGKICKVFLKNAKQQKKL